MNTENSYSHKYERNDEIFKGSAVELLEGGKSVEVMSMGHWSLPILFQAQAPFVALKNRLSNYPKSSGVLTSR